MPVYGILRDGQTKIPGGDGEPFVEKAGEFTLARWFKKHMVEGDHGFASLDSGETTIFGLIDSDNDLRTTQTFLMELYNGLLAFRARASEPGVPKVLSNPLWTGTRLVTIDVGAPVESWANRNKVTEMVEKAIAKVKTKGGA